jgi:hypothetical protein
VLVLLHHNLAPTLHAANAAAALAAAALRYPGTRPPTPVVRSARAVPAPFPPAAAIASASASPPRSSPAVASPFYPPAAS